MVPVEAVLRREEAGNSHSAKPCLHEICPMSLFAYLITQKQVRHHLKWLHCLCFTGLPLRVIWINYFICPRVMCSYHRTRPILTCTLQPYNEMLCRLLTHHETQWNFPRNVLQESLLSSFPGSAVRLSDRLLSRQCCFFFSSLIIICLRVLTPHPAELEGDPSGGLGCRLGSG